MGGHACGPTGLAAPKAWGAPQRWSSPRAGRRMGQVGLGARWPVVPTPCPLSPCRLLPPLVSSFLCGLYTCPDSLPCCPRPSDGSSGALLCVPDASHLPPPSCLRCHPPVLPTPRGA